MAGWGGSAFARFNCNGPMAHAIGPDTCTRDLDALEEEKGTTREPGRDRFCVQV